MTNLQETVVFDTSKRIRQAGEKVGVREEGRRLGGRRGSEERREQFDSGLDVPMRIQIRKQ